MVISVASGVLGQVATQSGSSTSQSADPMASMWNPQAMVDRSVKQAVKRYGLTPEQEQIARKLTVDGVNAFLDKHEQEVRDLAAEAIRAKLAGVTPTAEQAKAWADRAAPLVEEAKKAILDGNQEFRGCLTDEQKVKFDADQRAVEKQFVSNSETLSRWRQGGFDPTGDWLEKQGKPSKQENRPGLAPPGDRFERYARRFIQNYKLDASQASQVLAIAADNRKRAEEYSLSHKADIEEARAHVQELVGDAKTRDQYLAATKRLSELNRPVNDLYNQMRERLDKIPTDLQRQAYVAATESRSEAWRERARRRSLDTTISTAAQVASSQQVAAEGELVVATRPTATQPTSTRPVTSRPAASGPAASRPAASRPVNKSISH